MPSFKNAVIDSLIASFKAGKRADLPYKHWIVEHCLPKDAIADIIELPFPAPELGGLSGKREVHNATRRYFDAENMEKFPVCKAVNEALQDRRTTAAIEKDFGINLKGSYVRVEYAQDIDGFWLEPHTDLGVKLFTFLLYVSTEPQHHELGTDIYDATKKHVGRSPFRSNSAMIFVPSDITYHGFEPRTIKGVRKSVIINYVTTDWRAREQLAYPESPVA
jgi:hypothetical protein